MEIEPGNDEGQSPCAVLVLATSWPVWRLSTRAVDFVILLDSEALCFSRLLGRLATEDL